MEKIAYSRPNAVAARLLRESTAGQLLERPVLLTADLNAVLTPAGRSAFLADVSLLTRFCTDVSISVPYGAGTFADRARALAAGIHHVGTITFVEPRELKYHKYEAILNVGSTHRQDLPWTSIACDGWALQVCSTGGPIELSFAQFNPAAALATASLGATEIFKRLLGVLPSLGPMLDNEIFSLYSYTADINPGPEIRGPIRLDCLLAGVGAIGNGIRHVLLELPVEGWLAVIDCQAAGEENWGTYIDLDPTGFGKSKAELACAGWGQNVQAVPYNMDVRNLPARVGTDIPYPDLVLGALDNIEARHALQQLWPDVVIDGAIGDVTCQVSRHPWGPDTACLQCLFREPSGEDAAVVASRLTGLSVESASRQDEVVTQADINSAAGKHKIFLAARKGQQKCSVIREALAATLTAGALSFSPSAPFVACLTASMVAGEFIKARMGLDSRLDPRFQFNALIGPSAGTMLDQGRRLQCFCSQRASAVARLRYNARASALRAPRKVSNMGNGKP